MEGTFIQVKKKTQLKFTVVLRVWVTPTQSKCLDPLHCKQWKAGWVVSWDLLPLSSLWLSHNQEDLTLHMYMAAMKIAL